MAKGNFTKRDKDYMRKIGMKGGLRTSVLHGSKHFSKIGKKGYKVMKSLSKEQ